MKKHTGGCHCGKVRYEAETDLNTVISCNCSHCEKKGFLLSFIGAEQFKLLQGENDLNEYLFNKKKIQHLTCKNCGIQSFGKGTSKEGKLTIALNVRCLDGIDINSLKITAVDGKNW